MTDDVQALIDHVATTTALPRDQSRRLIDDVLAYFSETTEDWARRRHAELQDEGERNSRIFERLAQELPDRRFKSAALSQRQLRRIIYG